MNKKRLKVYHFFICWVLTLLTGLIIGSFFGFDIGLITTIMAALCSLPFILLFLLFQHYYLKKSPSKTELHTRTFLMHFIGSVLVFLGFIVVEGNLGNDMFSLLGIMLVYFTIDSIFFHSFIQRLYVDAVPEVHPEVLDILD